MKTLKSRLPPLKSVMAFEAVARHLSVTKAAEEACVSREAMSRQLRILEEYLGVKLFDRLHRAMSLTKAGKDFQITIAKTGEFQFRGTRRILVLYDGKTLTNKEDTLSEFDFSRTEFNISNSTSTTTSKKTQEKTTSALIPPPEKHSSEATNYLLKLVMELGNQKNVKKQILN